MILVTGTTGNFGSKAIEHLLKSGVPANNIAALARSKESSKALEELGINVRIGDYSDVDSLVKAFEGVDRLLLVSSSDRGDIGNRTAHHINAITAAKKANVNRIVYTAFIRKDDHKNSAIAAFQDSHQKSENFLKESGIPYTILQNGIYQEMILAFMGENVAEKGMIFFPAQNGKASWVLRDELAEAAAKVIIGEGHENKTYSLSNGKSEGFEQIASYLSKSLNKGIMYHSPESKDYMNMLKENGLPESIADMLVMWGKAIAENSLNLEEGDLESILGRKPKTVQEFIHNIYANS